MLAAAITGLCCGMAGRVVYLIGLYEVVAGLALGAAAVTLCHLARWRIGPMAGPLAAGAALVWLGFAQAADAWAFRQQQAQWLLDQPLLLAQDLAVAGVDSAMALVDAGLRAETGRDGLLGSWLAQGKPGIVVLRALGDPRVVPAPFSVRGFALGVSAAFVALVVWRALGQLTVAAACPRCGRFLRRRVLARVGDRQATALQQAWQTGDRALPTADGAPTVAVVYEDGCLPGHLALPGLALVGLRRHSWTLRHPGPRAHIAAVPADPTATAAS